MLADFFLDTSNISYLNHHTILPPQLLKMEDDLIVVDDEPQGPAPVQELTFVHHPVPTPPQPQPRSIAEAVMRSRRRSVTPGGSHYDRSMRSHAKLKAQPKLKLKLSEKAAAMASGTSFLGPYDRELDSDEEDLTFEEQFILRLPPGEDCDRLRKMVAAREASNDVWFKFKGE